MLDFDGTLSALAPTPAKAFLPAKTKKILQQCSGKFPVVIISGREVRDIKRKVSIPGIMCAGNHGLEWFEGNAIRRITIPLRTVRALELARKKIVLLQRKYPGSLVEDKYVVLAFHYRQVPALLLKKLRQDLHSLIFEFSDNKEIVIQKGKKVIELRPRIAWNKGSFARKALTFWQKKLNKKLLPLYIGDDATDEDVFTSLSSAITIRVGKSKTSQASYYLSSYAGVEPLLKNLCEMK